MHEALPLHRPWTYVGGLAMAGLGLALLASAWLLGDGLPLGVTMVVLVLGGLVELVEGESLRRHGGADMAHLVSGVLVASFATVLVSSVVYEPDILSPAPVGLFFGLYCLVNAGFRALDLLVDRPRAWASELLDTAVTLVVGGVLMATWRESTPASLGLWAGLEVLAGGLSLAGSARAMWKHPELAAYGR